MKPFNCEFFKGEGCEILEVRETSLRGPNEATEKSETFVSVKFETCKHCEI